MNVCSCCICVRIYLCLVCVRVCMCVRSPEAFAKSLLNSRTLYNFKINHHFSGHTHTHTQNGGLYSSNAIHLCIYSRHIHIDMQTKTHMRFSPSKPPQDTHSQMGTGNRHICPLIHTQKLCCCALDMSCSKHFSFSEIWRIEAVYIYVCL